MQGIETLGEILKTERERRGLSLEEVHDATKITVQNVTALEEDRFDNFPNKVYARAFLRDYANFLGLDSAELLTRYEEEWCAARETPAVGSKHGSVWKALAYALLALVVLGGVVVGGYFGWRAIEKGSHTPRPVGRPIQADATKGGATLPRPNVETVAQPKPAEQPKPVTPPAPRSVKLEVKTTGAAWMQVWVDGKSVIQEIVPKGQTKVFEGKKSVRVHTGNAGAVQLSLNGQPQPPLGPLGQIRDKTFNLPTPPPQAPASGAANASGTKPGTGGASTLNNAPAPPGAPSASTGARGR